MLYDDLPALDQARLKRWNAILKTATQPMQAYIIAAEIGSHVSTVVNDIKELYRMEYVARSERFRGKQAYVFFKALKQEFNMDEYVPQNNRIKKAQYVWQQKQESYIIQGARQVRLLDKVHTTPPRSERSVWTGSTLGSMSF